jgi:type IV secretion system protein TrbL
MRRGVGHSLVADAAGMLAERITLAVLGVLHRYAGGGIYRRVRRALLVVAVLASTIAFGVEPPPAPPSAPTTTATQYPFSPEQITAKLSTAVGTELNRLKNNTQLRSFGDAVTAFFLVTLLIWAAIKNMAGGKGLGEMIADWVPVFVSFGVVYAFLDRTAGEIIERTMDGIGASIAGANISTLDGALRAGMLPIFKAIAAIVDMPRVTATGTAGDSIFNGVVMTFLASAGSMVMAALAKVFTAFLLVLAGVVMAAHIIMGYVSVTLVLALAPVMVPFLMFKPLGWIFESWLKFLLGACMLKIVALFLLNVSAGLLTSVTDIATFAANEARGALAVESFFADVLLYGILIAFATLSALLMSQAPGIASGLLSGGTGSIGFSGVKGVAQSTAGKTPAMGGAAARQTGGLVQAPFSAWRGAVQGAKGQARDQVRRGAAARAAYTAGRGAGQAGRWAANKLRG